MDTTFAASPQTAYATEGGRTLTAVFERLEEAERAVSALRSAGFSEARIRLAGGGEASADRVAAPAHEERESFWERLVGFFLPDDESKIYEESLRRGLFLLTVTGVPADREAAAVSILDAEGALDLEGHVSEWRATGWSGEPAEFAPGGTAGMTGAEPVAAADETGHGPGGTAGMTGYVDPEAPPAAAATAPRRTGRRDASLEGVRVRAYDW